MDELKPCPFCGGKAIYTDNFDTDSNGGEYVTCTHCQMSTVLIYGIMEDAKPLLAQRWNRRAEYLAEKHRGMKISAAGVLRRISEGWKVDAGLRYGAGELLGHLQSMADQFYAGDIKVVDEFLQLYCLDGKREAV